MNTDTGEILTFQTEQAMEDYVEFAPSTKPIDPVFLSAFNKQQLAETGRTTVSRNSPCPCGSRKRFKRCCYTGSDGART
jgi:uncharacterized protein YecA (UPF0149 family)